MDHEKVNILLVDDQPAKLLAYEVILKELGENLVIAASGREARVVVAHGQMGEGALERVMVARLWRCCSRPRSR